MYGTITFYDLKQLAEFLGEFTGQTAKFEVHQDSNGRWVLTFTGGY
jgi:hypothetical protein